MIRFGEHRLWCPETINEVIGIDDRHVAVRGYQSLFVWDHHTGALVEGIDARSIPCGDPALIGIAAPPHTWRKVSPDGKWVAAGNLGNRVRVFDNTTGAMKFAGDPEYAYSDVAFSPDGTRLVGTSHGAYVWTSPGAPPVRIPDVYHHARFTGDDIAGGAYRGYVARWSLDGRERARVSVRHRVESMSWTADARRVAVTTIITGGLCMDQLPDIVVADVASGRALLRFHDPANIPRGAQLSPDGRWLALTDDRGVRICDASPRAPWLAPPVVHAYPDHRGIVLGAGDRALLIADGVAELVALPDGAADERAHGDGPWSWTPIGFCEVTPDQRRIRVHDARTLAVTRELGFDFVIDAFAVSRDRKRIALADDATLVVDELT